MSHQSGFLRTSAFQTEGAWNQDGKGASIWDFFTHSSTGGNSKGDTADVVSDSYNCWEEDVEALDYLGARAYSFSLSWPRLFPDGNAAGKPNAAALDGVQVFGYVAWSLVDGFEWNYGYSIRRGLFYVDFNQPGCGRTPKTSAKYYRQVVADNGFHSDEPSTEVKGHFPCNFHWGIADSTLQVT
uniref:Klotho beta n=1 Tax=Oryzias sinensis TaxID=183150 RepID=A0A8C8DLE0_9TELE